MLRNASSKSDHPILLLRQRRRQLAAIDGALRALTSTQPPPIGPRPTFALLAAISACVTLSVLVDGISTLLHPLFSVHGFAGDAALIGGAVAGLVVLASKKTPRTWQDVSEARLARLLCAYHPEDAQAYRDMQQHIASAGALQPEIIAKWHEKETAALCPATNNGKWRAVAERQL